MTYLTYSTSSHGGHRATTVSFHLVLFLGFPLASIKHYKGNICSRTMNPTKNQELRGAPVPPVEPVVWHLLQTCWYSWMCKGSIVITTNGKCILHIQVLLECCYTSMKSSQWEYSNHLLSQKFVLNRSSLSISRCKSKYDADLSLSVVSFISSSLG